MVRGHAKAVAQEKNLAKQAEKAKSVKRSSTETKEILERGIALTCPVCKQGMPNIGVYRNHFENKHPRAPLPPELAAPAESK
eukprot:gene24015-29062_t